MNGVLTAEQSKHLTLEEFEGYYTAGLVPPPDPETFARLIEEFSNRMADEIDKLETENETLRGTVNALEAQIDEMEARCPSK